jgi:hypothetical protein
MPTSTPTAKATTAPTPTVATATIGKDKVYLSNRMILDLTDKTLGCFGTAKISYAPTHEYFLVVLDCFEGDNEAFLFRADGSDKRRITGKWDYINYHEYEWASDGQSFTYQRVNDCCVVPPLSRCAKVLCTFQDADSSIFTPKIGLQKVERTSDDLLTGF